MSRCQNCLWLCIDVNLTVVQINMLIRNTIFRGLNIWKTCIFQKSNIQTGFIKAVSKTTVKLSNGAEMPIVGLGTWRAQPEEMENAVQAALENGYRHIDTAFNYNTEEYIGNVLSKWIESGKVKREELFITTKELESQVKKGLTKAIGLSNFNSEQVQRIHKSAEIKPVVNQVELHAYLQQKELRDACKVLDVAVTAFSPLGSPGANTHFQNKYNYSLNDFPDILGHPVVKELSEKYRKLPAQILLKHLIQQDVIVIPKSSNPERIKANIDLFDFELSEDDLEKLNALDKNEDGRIFDFMFFKGVDKHPEYPFKARLKV
nr:unnamed protein product [Callosobruchus chinensis]